MQCISFRRLAFVRRRCVICYDCWAVLLHCQSLEGWAHSSKDLKEEIHWIQTILNTQSEVDSSFRKLCFESHSAFVRNHATFFKTSVGNCALKIMHRVPDSVLLVLFTDGTLFLAELSQFTLKWIASFGNYCINHCKKIERRLSFGQKKCTAKLRECFSRFRKAKRWSTDDWFLYPDYECLYKLIAHHWSLHFASNTYLFLQNYLCYVVYLLLRGFFYVCWISVLSSTGFFVW